MRPLSFLETLISLSAAFTFSVFSWLLIEKPIRSKRVLSSRKKLLAVSFACILALAATGRIIKSTDGWPSRFPAQVLAYLDENESFENGKHYSCMKGARVNDFKSCKIGPENGGKASFILWGDSHAAAWAPGINELAEEYGINGFQYTMSSCAPLVGFERAVFSEGKRKPCLAFNENIQQIVKDKGVRHIVLAATFGTYIGEIKSPEASGGTIGADYFRRLLGGTIDALHQLGVTVWLVQGVPVHEYPVPKLLAKNFLSGGQIKDCALDYSDYRNFYAPVESVLKEFSNDDIRLLKITPPICNDRACFPGDERGAYYSDSNHFSPFGAKRFKNTFRPLFEAIRSDSAAR